MTGMDDLFIRYHLQDGAYSVSSSFDRHVNMSQGGFGGVAIAYLHPSKHLDAFLEKYDKAFQSMFRELGMQNGMITLQCFADSREEFYFYEAGYRLGGSQSYIFTDAVNQSNTLHYMINHALTGMMADYSIAERDDPHFKCVCVNLYIALKPGTIAVMNGMDEARQIPGVLNVTQLLEAGDIIEKTGSLSQVCARMHLIGDNKKLVNRTLTAVYQVLDIRDTNGQDMILEKFKFDMEDEAE